MTKLDRVVDGYGAHYGWSHHCPGCERSHLIGARWAFNGDEEFPTFEPSVLVTYNGDDAGERRDDGHRAPSAICHYFLRAGVLEFLGDCTHDLRGEKRALPFPPADE